MILSEWECNESPYGYFYITRRNDNKLIGHIEDKSNLAIIATAPEMLEALKTVTTWKHQGMSEVDMLKIVHYAIAKAEGEE